MNRNRVDSDAIRSIGYDAVQLILEIEFADGAVYRYHGVAAEMYAAFMSADSKGQFFQQFIRDD